MGGGRGGGGGFCCGCGVFSMVAVADDAVAFRRLLLLGGGGGLERPCVVCLKPGAGLRFQPKPCKIHPIRAEDVHSNGLPPQHAQNPTPFRWEAPETKACVLEIGRNVTSGLLKRRLCHADSRSLIANHKEAAGCSQKIRGNEGAREKPVYSS